MLCESCPASSFFPWLVCRVVQRHNQASRTVKTILPVLLLASISACASLALARG